MKETRGDAIRRRVGQCFDCKYRGKITVRNRDYSYCLKKKQRLCDMPIHGTCTERENA